MSTHARPLADWLAAADDAELEALFTLRGVPANAPWGDFFDAAEALLEPASLARALTGLTLQEARTLLTALRERPAVEDARPLIAQGLLRPDGTVPPPVAEALGERELPQAAEPAPPAPADDLAAARAAERALTTVSAVADLLLATRENPLALLATGVVSASEKRQLAEAGISQETVDDLVEIAVAAGLACAAHRQLRLTPAAERWLRSGAAERWTALAEGLRGRLGRGMLDASGGWLPPAQWAQARPWDPTWPRRSAALHEQALMLGLLADHDTEPEWALPLRSGAPVAGAALQRMLPAEVDRIYLQNDLSAIAPGPLRPELDVRLRSLATRESAAQASSYRFTAESITHALLAGETEASIVEFLAELSLTGIPQPLRYLIAQTAQRHGLVRVSTDAATGRTHIDSSDAHLLDTIAVDQSLRPLGLDREGASLTSRVGRETAYWALTDARYPANLVGDDGQLLALQRHAVVPERSEEPESHAALIAQLRARQGPDADAAWLDRELEAAVKAKSVLQVTVSMPDGSTRELMLEATGLGGGRLRGRDRAADVERTLPVSSIRSARVIEPAD